MENSEKKQNVIDTIDDLCSDFLFYDRKEDEELSRQDLINLVKTEVITIEEMVSKFKETLELYFEDEKYSEEEEN